jgi:hypothetical protein
MLIDGVEMSIKLALAPEAFYLLAPLVDTKLPFKILDATLFIIQDELKPPLLLAHALVDTKLPFKILEATLFITQVELKPPLLLAHANVLGMKRKAHYPVTLLRSKHLLRVLVTSRSLSIIHSLAQFQKEFSLHLLRTLLSLVLPVQIHSTFIIMI